MSEPSKRCMLTGVWSFQNSVATISIQYPSRMTADELQDFSDYVELLKKKIGRNLISPTLVPTKE